MKRNEKKSIFYICVAALLMSIPGCGWFTSAPTKKDEKTLHVINVNDTVLYEDAHIKGDSNIPFDEFENLDKLTKSWHNASPIVIYCTDYACTASKVVAKELAKLGFTDVSVYTGGAAEWHALSKKDNAYQMVGPQKQPYLRRVNEKIETTDPEIKVITAAELLKLLQKAD